LQVATAPITKSSKDRVLRRLVQSKILKDVCTVDLHKQLTMLQEQRLPPGFVGFQALSESQALDILPELMRSEEFKRLVPAFDPHGIEDPRLSSELKAVLNDHLILAHVLLGLFSWRRERRATTWPIDPVISELATEAVHILQAISQGSRSNSSNEPYMKLTATLDRLLTTVEKGLFSAPQPPVTSLLQSQPVKDVYLL